MRTGDDDGPEPGDVAKALLGANHFLTLEDTEEILRYQEGIYKAGAEAYIKRKLEENIESEFVTSHFVNEVIGHVQRSTLQPREIFEEKNPHLVSKNCLFNLKTFTREEFTHEHHSLNKLTVDYEPGATCPNILIFLRETLDATDILGVQEELGACLSKDYRTKKFSIYLGAPNSGKTTWISVISALLGQDNIASVSLQQIATNRFAIADLFGKLANIRDDLPKDPIKSAGLIKELTGRSRIRAERKFSHGFQFVNTAYLIFTCNDLPELEDDDGGFFDRVNIRKFKHVVPLERRDRNLIDRLTTQEELSGLLNWALAGLKRLKDNGWNFTDSQGLDEARQEYKRKSDPVWAFVQDYIEEDVTASVLKEDLYNSFKEYCERNGIPVRTSDYLYKRIRAVATVTDAYEQDGQGKRKWAFVGIRNRKKGEHPEHPEQTRL